MVKGIKVLLRSSKKVFISSRDSLILNCSVSLATALNYLLNSDEKLLQKV